MCTFSPSLSLNRVIILRIQNKDLNCLKHSEVIRKRNCTKNNFNWHHWLSRLNWLRLGENIYAVRRCKVNKTNMLYFPWQYYPDLPWWNFRMRCSWYLLKFKWDGVTMWRRMTSHNVMSLSRLSCVITNVMIVTTTRTWLSRDTGITDISGAMDSVRTHDVLL